MYFGYSKSDIFPKVEAPQEWHIFIQLKAKLFVFSVRTVSSPVNGAASISREAVDGQAVELLFSEVGSGLYQKILPQTALDSPRQP